MSEALKTSEVVEGPTTEQLAAVVGWLALGSPAADDPARIDRIQVLEQLKHAAAGAQAVETVLFKASQLAEQQAAGIRKRDLGKGITEQVALARRESPGRTTRLVSMAEDLVLELPETLRALRRGELSEWRAMLLARETAFLSAEHRRTVDSTLASKLAGLSDRAVVAEARRLGYELDPRGFVTRGKKAHEDRHVSMRPAPDTMARFSALLPAAQGAALFGALVREADARRSAGDERSRGQVMADTLVERVTGQAKADQVPVEVQLVMSDRAMFGFDEVPAMLASYGPLPAPSAREWLRRLDPETQAWLRRLYTDPTSGQLTHVDRDRRLFRSSPRTAILARDQWCRTPWCGAPIRHIDHCVPIASGGRTTERNGQGLCEACNLAKEAPGWRALPDPGGGAGRSVTLTTPTGHTYGSSPPVLPGSDRRRYGVAFDLPRMKVDRAWPDRSLAYAG